MTSALAAALRELQHSRDVLEKELDAHPAFADWQRLQSSLDTTENVERRRTLLASLEHHPVFRAWRSVVASYDMLNGETGAPAARTAPTERIAHSEIAARRRPAPGPAVVGGMGGYASPRRFSPPPGPPQALTAIRGVTASLAQRLEAMGIQRYAQIAEWTADDVGYVRTALGLGKDISRRNWIEQAAMLDAKGDRRARRGEGPGRGIGREQSVAPALSPAPQGRAQAPATSVAALLASASAAFSTSAPASVQASPKPGVTIDVEAIRAAVLGAAAIAARAVADRRASHDQPSPETKAPDVEVAFGKVSADVAIGAVPAEPTIAWTPAAGHITFIDVRPSRRPLPRSDAGRFLSGSELHVRVPEATPAPSQPDTQAASRRSALSDLRHISDIGSTVAGQLARAGIDNFATIADWRRADIERIAKILEIDWRRICREGWIEQAALLATGRPSAFAARVMRGDLDALCPAPLPPPPVPVLSPLIVAEKPTGTSISASDAITVAPPPAATAIVSPARITVDPPSIELRPPTADIEQELPDIEPVEAVVSVVRVSPPTPPASPSPGIAVSARVAEAFHAAPQREPYTVAPSIDQDPPDHWIAPAVMEEAAVEIVRKDGEVTAAYGPSSSAPATIRMPTSRLPAPANRANAQPVWIAQREAEAGSVVRRFLKALKRDG